MVEINLFYEWPEHVPALSFHQNKPSDSFMLMATVYLQMSQILQAFKSTWFNDCDLVAAQISAKQ